MFCEISTHDYHWVWSWPHSSFTDISSLPLSVTLTTLLSQKSHLYHCVWPWPHLFHRNLIIITVCDLDHTPLSQKSHHYHWVWPWPHFFHRNLIMTTECDLDHTPLSQKSHHYHGVWPWPHSSFTEISSLSRSVTLTTLLFHRNLIITTECDLDHTPLSQKSPHYHGVWPWPHFSFTEISSLSRSVTLTTLLFHRNLIIITECDLDHTSFTEILSWPLSVTLTTLLFHRNLIIITECDLDHTPLSQKSPHYHGVWPWPHFSFTEISSLSRSVTLTTLLFHRNLIIITVYQYTVKQYQEM